MITQPRCWQCPGEGNGSISLVLNTDFTDTLSAFKVERIKYNYYNVFQVCTDNSLQMHICNSSEHYLSTCSTSKNYDSYVRLHTLTRNSLHADESLYTCFPTDSIVVYTCIALQRLVRTKCNHGLQPVQTNQCSQSFLTHLHPYYQKHLQNYALSAGDWKYRVNKIFGIFDWHIKMIHFT